MKTKLTFFDILAALLVLLIALLPPLFGSLAAKEAASVRVISEGGEAIYELSVDREVELRSHGHRLVIEISGGSARVIQSDCDDGICMASGAVRESGDLIVCAPAGVRIEPMTDEVDYVVG